MTSQMTSEFYSSRPVGLCPPKNIPCSFAHHKWEPVNIFICMRKFSKYTKPKQETIQTKIIEEHSDMPSPLILQQARVQMGLTQKELARIINLHWTIIRDAELGKENVDLSHIEIIFQALNKNL